MSDDRSARINAVADEFVTNLRATLGQLSELIDLDVTPAEALELFKGRGGTGFGMDQIERLTRFTGEMTGSLMFEYVREPMGMPAYIEQLFKDKGTKIGDGDTPVIENATLVLRTFPQVITGVLARTPTGCLKLGSVGRLGPQGPEVLIDQVFEVDDVLWIATTSEIKPVGVSSLFSAH